MTLAARFADGFGLGRVVTANLRLKALSDIVARSGRFLLVLVAARVLGPDGFGLYAFAFAFGNILANAADFGLQMYLSREVAKGSVPPRAVLGQVIRAKLLLSAAVLVLLAAAFAFYPRPLGVRWLLVLMGAASLVHSWNELWNYFFRGLQSLRQEAILTLFDMLAGSALGIALLLGGAGVRGLVAALLAAEIATLVLALSLLGRRGHLALAATDAPALAALRDAAPIGVAILLSILYFRIDAVLLERLTTDQVVGAYGAAYKILEAFIFIPAAFLAAVYPAFARTTVTGPEAMRRLYRSSLGWLTLLGAAIVAGVLLFAPLGLRVLYGARYTSSIPLLRVLSFALFFIFVNYALTHFLVALRGQKWNAIFAGACTVVNVGANLALIPLYGAMGAAIATVATEATLFALCFLAVRRLMARHAREWDAGRAAATAGTA